MTHPGDSGDVPVNRDDPRNGGIAWEFMGHSSSLDLRFHGLSYVIWLVVDLPLSKI